METKLSIPGVQEIRTDELILRRSDSSTSVFTNSVVRFIFSLDEDEKIREVIELYKSKNKSFSWWVGPSSKPNDLSSPLKSLGFTLDDVYIGLAVQTDQANSNRLSQWYVEEARTESELRDHVSVSASVWGMDSALVEAAVRERIFFSSVSEGRGGGS